MSHWPFMAGLVFHGLRIATCARITVVDEGGIRALGGTEPLILVANHQSHADTPVMLAAMPPTRRRRARFVASATRFSPAPRGASMKERVERWFMRGLAVHGYRSILVGGEEGGIRSVERISEALAQGATICMYPEGTRSRDGTLGRLRPGVAMLAIATGVKVVPLRIDGTLDALPKSRRFPRLGSRIVVRVRPGIVAERTESHAHFSDRVAAALARHPERPGDAEA